MAVGKTGSVHSRPAPSADVLTAALDLLRSIGGAPETRDLVTKMAAERKALDAASKVHSEAAQRAKEREGEAQAAEAEAREQRQILANDRATFEREKAETVQRHSDERVELDGERQRLQSLRVSVDAIDRKVRGAAEALRPYLEEGTA